MKYHFLRGLFLAVFALCLNVHGTYAQQIVKDMKKPMPDYKTMSDEEFVKMSTLYKEEPFGDSSLAYSVRLPKNWSKREGGAVASFSLSDKVLGEIDRFYGPVRMGERSYFSVQAIDLQYKITAEQWFIIYMLENGYTMQGIKTTNDNRVEVVYVLINNGVTYVVTAVAQLSGSSVVFAQFITPVDAWMEEQASALKVVNSFELQNVDESFVEPMMPYQFLDIASVDYPKSWKIKVEPLRSVDQMSISLLNLDQTNGNINSRVLNGRMEVNLISKYIVEDIDEDIKQFLSKANTVKLVIQDEIETLDDFIVDENVEIVQVKVYSAADKNQALGGYEYWLAVLSSGEYYYYVSLLTPARNSDYFDWARNTQTFRLVTQNIRPLL